MVLYIAKDIQDNYFQKIGLMKIIVSIKLLKFKKYGEDIIFVIG